MLHIDRITALVERALCLEEQNASSKDLQQLQERPLRPSKSTKKRPTAHKRQPKRPTPPRHLPRSIESLTAAQIVRRHFDEQSLNQLQFAESLGMTDRTLRKFLKTGKLRRSNFDEMAKRMKTTPENLLSGSDPSEEI